MYQKRSFSSSSNGSRPARTSHGRSSFGGGGRGGSSSRFGRSSSPNRGGNRNSNRGAKSDRIDISKFVNKAVITEEIEHFVPEHKFADFQLDERLKKAIAVRKYVLPTPIQDRTIAHTLQGRDVVGIANTGTGKTAAFLIPLINKVIVDSKENIIVVVPTRELAIQIDEEFRALTKALGIFSVCCVGGAPINKQIGMLRRRNNFVIGTPGRLKDLVERKVLILSQFKTIVLDEADRMLDMGFINDMKYVMAKMPTPRHTLFFSATLSKEIEALISQFLTEPIRVSVKTQDTSKNVEQDIVRVTGGSAKIDVLEKLLKNTEFNKVLIFGRTKHGVEKLSKTLRDKGFNVESIHGDKPHNKRQKALGQFKDNQIQVLVATDVAARGLDIPNVSHVINYDVPATYEDYVHRIGRTGRANNRGKALTFIE